MNESHAHLVVIDDRGLLTIYRVQGDKRHVYTSVQLPAPSSDPKTLGEFCKMLGENILLDSPVARRLLNL